jgi:long-subunit acyl-CoA synthetase (AMP-forming)
MAEFSWLDEFATHAADEVLLFSPTGDWSAGDIHNELLTLGERLSGSRVVGVLADNSPAWVLADLACQTAGIVHLPLPGFFNAEQLRHALEQSGADTVLTDQPERIGQLDLGFAITGRRQGLTWLRRVVDAVALPPGTAKISFTSGSTGAPKGVCLSAEGLIDTAQAVRERLADLPLTRHLAVLPLALLLENVAGVYAPLLRRTPVHLPALSTLGWAGMAGFDPAALDRAVHDTQPASLILVPELLKAWTLFLAHSGPPRGLPSGLARPEESLEFVAVGGARVAPELLATARQAGIPAYQGYGLTEGGSVLAINRPGDDGQGVGRPLAHAQLHIESGELFVRTRAFLGYAGLPAPDADANGFPTGDLANVDAAGHLHLAGRRKNLLITSFGRNISPEWVEAGLLANPQILQGIVVGDGQAALSAIIVPMPGSTSAAIEQAIQRTNNSLPDYARIAHYITSPPFTPGNGLATGNGRPLRPAIIEHHRAALAALYAQEELSRVVL